MNIKYGRKRVSQETCVKFLGVLLDSTLSWTPHLTELSKKLSLSRTVGLLYKIRHFGIFYPFLSYGVQVWGLTYPHPPKPRLYSARESCKSSDISDIKTSSLPLFNELQLLRLTVSNLLLASFVYGCVNSLSPQFFENYFTSIASKHGKGTRGNLFLERQKTIQYGIKSISIQVQSSGIPFLLKLVSSTVKQFRTELKKYYLKSYEID